MKTERFISERLRFKGRMAVAATAISYFVIIVAVTVSSGFRNEIRNGLSGMSGDIVLSGDRISLTDSLKEQIYSFSEVESAAPAIYRAGIVKRGTEIQGIMVKGVPGRDSSLTASIPSTLSRSLGIKEGGPLLTYFVEERMKVRRFTVESIYESPVAPDESMIVYVPIEDMRRLNGWAEEEASAIEVQLKNNRMGKEELLPLAAEMGERCSLQAESIRTRFSQLFDWLDLLDFNVIAILVLMTIVAGFNMISGLYIYLFRNISTIGILKSLGMTDRSIGNVFLRVSARTVAIGMVIGNALALLFCLLQGTTHLLKLNPENYFLSYVPVNVNLPFILAADIISFLLIMLMLLIPTLFIAKVDPAETAKSE